MMRHGGDKEEGEGEEAEGEGSLFNYVSGLYKHLQSAGFVKEL